MHNNLKKSNLWKNENSDNAKRSSKNYRHVYHINNMSNRRWDRSKNNSYDSQDPVKNEIKKETIEESIETNKKVLELQTTSGLDITQINGQRKLGPPRDWVGEPPSPECEVFVGHLPRNVYEDVLFPIFQTVGEIYEIRLMMDFSGTNRGYCFVMYTKPEYATKAIKELNEWPIQHKTKIGVVASVNNCRLCIGHLPIELDTENFTKKIYDTTEYVSKVSVYRSVNKQQKTALISFKTHIAAAMARRKLVPKRTDLFPGIELTIDWAHPNASMYNVVEESGTMNEDGEIQITKKYIPPGKNYSRLNNDHASKNSKFSNENSGEKINEWISDKIDASNNLIGHKAKQIVKSNYDYHQRVTSDYKKKIMPLNPISKRPFSMHNENNHNNNIGIIGDVNNNFDRFFSSNPGNSINTVACNSQSQFIRPPFVICSDNKENIPNSYLIPYFESLNLKTEMTNNIGNGLPQHFTLNGINYNQNQSQNFQMCNQKNLIMTSNILPSTQNYSDVNFNVYQKNFGVERNQTILGFNVIKTNSNFYNQQFCPMRLDNLTCAEMRLPSPLGIQYSQRFPMPLNIKNDNLNKFGNRSQESLVKNSTICYRPQYDTKAFGFGKVNSIPVNYSDNQVPRPIFKSQY